MSKFRYGKLFIFVLVFILLLVALSFWIPKADRIELLYATKDDTYDPAAYGNFQQTLEANVQLEKKSLLPLSARKLNQYDAIYVDPSLLSDERWSEDSAKLIAYVENGGHLFLENGFANRFPPQFLGAQQVVQIPPMNGWVKPSFAYPDVAYNLQGLQKTFRLFAESYFKRTTMNDLPDFQWGYGIVPSSAQTLVAMNQLSLCTVNQHGEGTVLLSSTFLPNRYFPTGYDMQSGSDPAQGFAKLAAQYDESGKPVPGTAYFNKRELPLEPYFNFTFAAANMQYRSELLSYVSKEKLGYSIKKVLGPYGRPAMAFQNHFEAMPAIQQKDGIAWAELLKKYDEIPSFTLVRNAFYWGQWRESVTVQLNTGTNEKPSFEGELPGSGYSSGMHLMSGGQPLRQALFPQYRDLASAIELPYRAYPAAVTLNGHAALMVGSADGAVYAYTAQGQDPAAYASEPPPEGMALPQTFGAQQKLELESGEPLQLGAYSTVHAADVNGDGLTDLVVSDESGAVKTLAQHANGRFAPPAALLAGGKPLQAPGGPAGAAVADVNGDGAQDLVLGGADGRVYLYKGRAGSSGLTLEAGSELLKLPDGRLYAAPSVRDMNGDGRADLVVGSNEGDLQVFLQGADGAWSGQGPLEGATLNQVGNRALVAGHNSVPLWLDVNGDGADDLIVGGIEFGSPVAIDDPKFPYKEELKAFIQYASDNHLELNPHIFVHNFKTDEQERQELALHRKAFDTLGIPWQHPGTNQHTWRVNYPNRQQTLLSEQAQGMWYNFGFFPAHSPVISRPDDMWSLPFLLQNEQGQTDKTMLIHTPTPYLRLGESGNEDIFQSMADLDMPIDYFEHIEYHFPVPGKIAELTAFADYFDKLRDQRDYNFMTETQMAKSFVTAMQGKVQVSRPWAFYLWDKLKDRLASGNPHWRASLTPDTSAVSELAGEYAGTLGVVIEKGERFASYSLNTDSGIYDLKENRLYIGLPGQTSVRIQRSDDRFHVVRSNVPFTLSDQGERYEMKLESGGLQQIKLYSADELRLEPADASVKIERDEQTHTYTITRYGGPTTLSFSKAQSP